MFTAVCLVHYHEIGLKGKNRAKFENLLKRNLNLNLQGMPVESITRISGHLLVVVEDEKHCYDVAQRIAHTPGVARVSIGYRCSREEEEFKAAARLAMSQAEPFESFKVEARRSNTDYPINSMELNQILGAYLCENFPDKKVRMKDPDLRVVLRIIQGSAYVYAKTFQGVGGLPVGSAGKLVCLLSSGIDSPLACWKMMKRGAQIVPLHFSGRPQTSDDSEYLVRDIVRLLATRGEVSAYYTVPFGDIQKEIAAVVPQDLRIIMYRRMMYLIASELADKLKAKGIVNGESLGQVASQTLENIMAVDEMSHLPVFRPLIGSDKQEIIQEAQALGSFEISTEQATDCCTLFMPRNPETHAKLSRVHEVWGTLDVESLKTRAFELMEKTEL